MPTTSTRWVPTVGRLHGRDGPCPPSGCLAALVVGLAGCGGSGTAGPDSEIAFVTSRDGYYTIYGMRADGSGQERLSPSGPIDRAHAHSVFQTEPD